MNPKDIKFGTKTYRIIYSFNIMDEIRAGKEVYMLDRELRCVECVNDMEVETLCKVLEQDNVKERFEFWVEEKGGKKE